MVVKGHMHRRSEGGEESTGWGHTQSEPKSQPRLIGQHDNGARYKFTKCDVSAHRE